ncbi:MAG: Dabb family protein [Fibromonadales bacterium]|nr:Dabb family protein [Fibromonadales bacterium]
MIKHLVFWKMKPVADNRTGKENAEVMAQRLNALKTVIPFAVEIEAGVNFNETSAAYDVGLYSAFKTKEDLNAYQKHPAHLQVAEWINSGITESRAVVDYEIEGV